MNSTKEQYAQIARIAYVINGAHKVGAYDRHVTVTYEDRDIVTVTVLHGNSVDCVVSTSDLNKVLDTLEPYVREADGELSRTNVKRKEAVSKMLAGARNYAISQGFDLAQEAWNNIFNECMDNFNELEAM